MSPTIGLLLLALASQAPTTTTAPPDEKVTVFVARSGDDAVGTSLAQEITSAMAKSSVSSPIADRGEAQAELFISTLNPDPAKPGIVTTVAWTLVYSKDSLRVYLGSGLRFTDRERVAKTAAEMVAYADELLKARRGELPGSSEWRNYATAWNEEVNKVADTLPEDACGVRVRDAFKEEMRAVLRWSIASNTKFDVQKIIRTAMVDYTTDEEFVKKLESQTAKLAQCQSELAAVKKTKK